MSIQRTIGSTEAPRADHRPKVKPIVAGVTTLALGLSGVFLTAGPASAAPGSSEAEARFVSGNLLEGSLDDLAAIAGERAVADSTTAGVVTESGDLDLSVLSDLIDLQIADGVSIPLSGLNAGAVTQYAQASQAGSSRAATGAVTDQGVVDLGSPSGAPEALNFNLNSLLSDELAASIADVSLTAGVTTATADQPAGGAPVGDYNIAGLQANITSPLIANLSPSLVAAGDTLDGTVAGVLGPDGSLVGGLTGALSALGAADVTVAATTDLSAVVAQTIQARSILGADGPVEVNLSTGEITVDIAALLEANGRDLNDLAPGEEILSTELIGFITADVDELVNGLLQEVQTAVTSALATTDLTVAATIGTDEDPVFSLDLGGSLEAISTGAVTPQIELFGNELDISLLTGAIGTAVSGVLALQLDTAALDADLAPLYPGLDSVLSDLVSLRANVQETAAGTFTETALRLEVLNFTVDEEALVLNLAQATVGPNAVPTVDPTDPVAPTILGIDPIFGPEAGGTQVTITGTDLSTVTSVTFGGVAATAITPVSATEITVLTPPGVGLVDVAVTNPAGTATLQDGFSYIPAGGGPGDPGVIISFTPTSGPEDGGTSVNIVGTGFTGADGVLFGDVEGTDFTVISDNEITVTSPAGTGSVTVTVTGAPNGDIVAPTPFVYIPETGGAVVTVSGVTPLTGPEAGGTLVTITGSGFNAIDEVRFNGVAGTELAVVSDTQLTVLTPAGVGQVPITLVDTAVNGGTVTSPIPFTYIPANVTNPPFIDTVTPGSGPTSGGTIVTIIGGNFTEGSTVNFGGTPATSVTVVSPTEIRATAPAGTGVVDVSVIDGSGQTATLPQAFSYIAPSASGAGSNAGNAKGAGNLASTGADGVYAGGIAALVMLLGGGALFLLRRKLA